MFPLYILHAEQLALKEQITICHTQYYKPKETKHIKKHISEVRGTFLPKQQFY